MAIRLPSVFNGRPLRNVRIPREVPATKPQEKIFVIVPHEEETIEVLPVPPEEITLEATLMDIEPEIDLLGDVEIKPSKAEITSMSKAAALKAVLDLGLVATSSMRKEVLVGMLLKHHGLD